MKALAAMVLTLTATVLAASVPDASARVPAQEKKDEKKEPKKEEKKDAKKVESPKLEGKYVLVAGKVNDKPMDDAAKKWNYVITADTITIAAPEPKKEEKKGEKPQKFVFSYKLDATASPIQIDMAILDGPEGTKGSKAEGIVEVKEDVLKLAYSMEKEKRPKDFEGKEGNVFEFKKMK